LELAEQKKQNKKHEKIVEWREVKENDDRKLKKHEEYESRMETMDVRKSRRGS
jgi:hypothetical protein